MIQPGLYRHYKGPRYRVLNCGRNASNDSKQHEWWVLYVAIEGPWQGEVYVRPAREFEEHVELTQQLGTPIMDPARVGRMVKRFEFIRP